VKVEVMLNNKIIANNFKQTDTSCEIDFNDAELINTDQSLTIKII